MIGDKKTMFQGINIFSITYRVLDTHSYLDEKMPHPDHDWLLALMGVVDRFIPETEGRNNVYLACLWNCDRDLQHGIYVGETGKTIQERYYQHKAGYKAGRKWVMR